MPPEFYTESLDKNGNGDAFVAAIEIAVVAELGAAFDCIAGILLEDTPFFTKNDARNETFLLATEQGGTQGSTKGAAFPGGTVTVDDLDGEHSGLLCLAEFRKEKAAGLINGGKAGFNIEGLESGHEETTGIVHEERV